MTKKPEEEIIQLKHLNKGTIKSCQTKRNLEGKNPQ